MLDVAEVQLGGSAGGTSCADFMDIVIAGAGIGGLTAALSLQDAGFDRIMVLESAPQLRPMGAGVNLQPVAVRELASLGLYRDLRRNAAQIEAVNYVDRTGRLVVEERRGRAAGCDWPQLALSRELLQSALLGAVRARCGTEIVRTGARVLGLSQDDRRVTVQIETGTVTGDVVIGADGLRSTVRREVAGGESEPNWNGVVVWRGMTRVRPPRTVNGMHVAGDEQQKVVVYPVTSPARDGSVLVNWVASRRLGNPTDADKSDWNRRVPADKFASEFSGWDVGGLDVPGLFEATEYCTEFPMLDHDPLPCWTRGRVTLLGDAAHAMRPHGSNATTQAMIDGRAVAYCLAKVTDPAAALAEYERHRRPLTSRIQLANRSSGPEAVLDISRRFRVGELQAVCRHYAELAASDRDSVNVRTPYDIRRARLLGPREPALAVG